MCAVTRKTVREGGYEGVRLKKVIIFNAYHCIIYSRHYGRSKFKRVEESLRQHRRQKEIAKQPPQNRVEVSKPDFSE